MPTFHGKKYWREVAQYMEPISFWPFTWQPKPPIVNIHGIHTLQLPGDVEKARKLTFLLSLIIFICGMSFLVTAILEFNFNTVTALNLFTGCLMIGTYFYTMLEVVLKQDYVIQYEELSQNGLLDLTQTHLRKMSAASKCGKRRVSTGLQERSQNMSVISSKLDGSKSGSIGNETQNDSVIRCRSTSLNSNKNAPTGSDSFQRQEIQQVTSIPCSKRKMSVASGNSSRLIVQNRSILTPVEPSVSNNVDPHAKKHSNASDVMHGLSSMLTGKAYHDETHKARFSSLSHAGSSVSPFHSEHDAHHLDGNSQHLRNISTLSNDPSAHSKKGHHHHKNKNHHAHGHHGFKNIQKVGQDGGQNNEHQSRRKSKKRKDKDMASKDIALIMSFGK